MHTLQQQIDFIQRISFADLDPDSEYYRSVLASLEKLKGQENLIDQQADELNIEYRFKRTATHEIHEFAADLFPMNSSDEILEKISQEISVIKELTTKIANKFEVNLDSVHRDATAAIDELKKQAEEKGYEVEAKDPTVLSLVGDVSRLPHSEIMRILGLISNDIAILEGLFNRGGMTVGERDGILDSMTYKTTDLDLLDRAAKYLQYYLPF